MTVLCSMMGVVLACATTAFAVVLNPPQPLSPRHGMSLTDVALHFQFRNCTAVGVGFEQGCVTYEVQLSDAANFSGGELISLPTLAYCCEGGGAGGACGEEGTVLRRCSHDCAPGSSAGSSDGACDADTKTTSLWHARPGIQSFFPTLFANATGMFPLSASTGAQGSGAPSMPSMPRPGRWWWRVRGFDRQGTATLWSNSTYFDLNNDRTPRAGGVLPRFAPSASRLFFHLEAFTAVPQDVPAFERAIAETEPELLRSATVALCLDNRAATELPNTWAYRHNRSNPVGNDTWGGAASYELLGDFYAPVLDDRSSGNGSASVGLLIAVEQGPHWAVDWQSLAEIEWLFQRSERFVGTRVGERFWNWWWYRPGVQAQKQAYALGLMTLCAKYGRVCVWGDGNHLAYNWNRLLQDSTWRPHLRRLAATNVLLPKTNIIPHWYSTQAATFGAWLTGLSGSFGTWAECWYWSEAGWGALDEPPSPLHNGDCAAMPPSFWAQQFVLGAAHGGTYMALEGEGCSTDRGTPGPGHRPDPPAIWSVTGQPTSTWTRLVAPFLRALVVESLVPPREDVVAATRLAVRDNSNYTDPAVFHAADASCRNLTCFSDGRLQPLFNGTYGYRNNYGILTDIIPTTGRFGFVPLLPNDTNIVAPPVMSSESHRPVPEIVPLSDTRMRSDATVRTLAESLYPSQPDGNSAWMTRVDGGGAADSDTTTRFFAMAARENANVSQTFRVEGLHPGRFIRAVRGTVGVHEYCIGRSRALSTSDGFNATSGERIFVQAQSNYNFTRTVLAIACAHPPANVTVVPPGALLNSTWVDGEQWLDLSHTVALTIDVVVVVMEQ